MVICDLCVQLFVWEGHLREELIAQLDEKQRAQVLTAHSHCVV